MDLGVVLLKRINDRRLRLIYREDGKVVKHDFWYTPPAEGFVFAPSHEAFDPRSQEVYFAINMESRGSRYDKDSGIVSTVSVKRIDYLNNRYVYQEIASLRTYQTALAYWKMCSHAIGDKLYYSARDKTRRVENREVDSLLSRRKVA
jgi:hypothetical protein